jgi:hypothetical protein
VVKIWISVTREKTSDNTDKGETGSNEKKVIKQKAKIINIERIYIFWIYMQR